MAGLFGVWASGFQVGPISYRPFKAFQHRGRRKIALALSNGDNVYSFSRNGLVDEAFTVEQVASLQGRGLIGIVAEYDRGQPCIVSTKWGNIGLVFEGKVFNKEGLIAILKERDQEIIVAEEHHKLSAVDLTRCHDIELIAYLVASSSEGTLSSAIIKDCLQALWKYASYALLIISTKSIYAARDPFGRWPFCIGKIMPENYFVISSESCVFPSIGATYEGELKRGHLTVISDEWHEIPATHQQTPDFCAFEIPRQRPDSIINDIEMGSVKQQLGMWLYEIYGRELIISETVISWVPDGGLQAAIGFSQAAKKCLDAILVHNRYLSESVKMPSQMLKLGHSIKHSLIKCVVQGKRVILIDSFLVKGGTIKSIITQLYQAGALRVDILIAFPPVIHPCRTSVRMNTTEEYVVTPEDSENSEALWSKLTNGEKLPGSVNFLPLEVFRPVVEEFGLCTSCLTGKYRI